MAEEDDKTVYEEVEIEDDSDDDLQYEEVPEDEPDDEEVDFAKVLSTIKLKGASETKTATSTEPAKTEKIEPKVQLRPPVIDDFIRNFLVKSEMFRTLDAFQAEWYELQSKGKIAADVVGAVPDIYLQNEQLDADMKATKAELERMRAIAEKAKSTWDKLRKERDFHRMHHRRVVQEKNLLLVDMKRIKKHAASFEPALAALTERYDKLMREKTMVRLEKDKLSGKVDSLTQQLKTLEELNNAAAATEKKEEVPKTTIKKKSKESEWPADRVNPFLSVNFEPTPATTFNLQKTFKGHAQAISGMALHPRKPILATVSDDASWKMWSIPTGDLIMSGDGHKDWVSSCDFNPKGTALATGSGDGTVKVWDFVNACCAATFGDHTQAVWGVAYHDSGDFLVSCSMDHSAKLWDLTSQKCRQSMRGHVDSVNSVCFQPFSNYLCTGSGDKTVSMWDMRTALCVQTFYGHRNAVNHVAFSLQGDMIVSSDADGIIKVWDVRMVAERFQIDAGTIGSSGVRHAANAASIDRSGKVLASASNGGPVRLYSLDSGEHLGDLQGHDAAVQAVLFDPQGKFIVSAGADNTFRVWS